MTERKPKTPTRYADAGVDIDAGNRLVDLITPVVRSTRRPGTEALIGGFSGLFDLKAAGFKDPVLVATTDGVGTKVKLAVETGRHDTIGIDLVAMCVNDLIVQGAEPLFFLNYFATGKLDPAVASAVVTGIADGCRQAGAALIGGETAEMPGIYSGGDYDLAGFAVGAVERDRILPRGDVAPGDVLLGLASSGVHSNGYSLVRHLVALSGLDWNQPAPFASGLALGAALLTPTRIYVKPLLSALAGTSGIKALAHITGGGLVENVPRVLPDDVVARINLHRWSLPPVFRWLRQVGAVEEAEMLRTFNCGIGMVVVVDAAQAAAVTASLVAGGGDGAEDRNHRGRRRARRGRLRRAPCRGRCMTRKRVAILISGRGSNMAALIAAAAKPDYPAAIVLVVSDNPTAAGLRLAAEADIPVAAIDRTSFANKPAFEAAMDAELHAARAELICLAGFMRLLSPGFVEHWRDRILNVHPSLLPAFKGVDTHRRAIEAGVRLHGCTIHFVRAPVDEGPIIAQAAIPVLAGDTAETLSDRLLIAEHRVYPMALRLVASGRARVVGERVVIDGEPTQPEAPLLVPWIP